MTDHLHSKRPTTPDPVQHRGTGFKYGPGGFHVNQHGRETFEKLNALYFPEKLKLVRARKDAAKEYKEKAKKPWIAAQLKHYGIECNPADRKDILESLLKEAIRSRRCEEVPAAIRAIEAELKRQWTPLSQAHQAELRDFDVKEKKRKREVMSRLPNATAQAEYDLDMFLKMHFFDAAGKPDENMTPNAIALPGLSDRAAVHAAAERLGMKTWSGGKGELRTICIGWHDSAVYALSSHYDRESAAAEVKAKAEKAKLKLEAQDVYRARNRYPGESRVFDLRNLIGSWDVSCEELEDGWGVQDLTLDISESGDDRALQAAFNFGILEGTMILSLTEQDLISYRQSLEDSGRYITSGKPTTGLKRKQGSIESSRNSKRRKDSGSHTARDVFLQWRGRETGEGEIQLDHDNSNRGTLAISSDHSTFTGTMSIPFVGDSVLFEGAKVSDELSMDPEPWDAFSSDAYEEARVSRWR